MGRENRRFERLKVDVMEINGMMMFANEVEILDISMGGLSLRADRRLNIGNEYGLKIKDKANVIPLKGTVMWALLSGTRENPNGGIIPLYTAGMRFSDLSGERIEQLTRFIAEQCHKRCEDEGVHGLSELRVSIRYAISAGKPALLDYREGYRVKKISPGGMLIESIHELEREKQLPMELPLPGDAIITFGGRVASCLRIRDEEPRLYDIGIEFADMPERDREILAEFISTLSDEHLSSQ